MRQIEQLHSLTVTRAGASTSKAIAPQWQPPRCVTSAAASGTGASRPGRGKQARAIVTQLADRFVDVRMRQMRALLDEALGHRRRPAARQLLQRADVEIAVVEEGIERARKRRSWQMLLPHMGELPAVTSGARNSSVRCCATPSRVRLARTRASRPEDR